MFDVLMYNYMTAEVFAQQICSLNRQTSLLEKWYLNGRRPENVVVKPTTSIQYITPSSKNYYLNSVTVEPISTTPTTTTPETEEEGA